jgi:hypothetical protein
MAASLEDFLRIFFKSSLLFQERFSVCTNHQRIKNDSQQLIEPSPAHDGIIVGVQKFQATYLNVLFSD